MTLHKLTKSTFCPHQELLLLTYDHADSTESHPAYERLWFKTELMHYVKSNQCACASKTSSAVHCHSLIFANVLFGKIYESCYNVVFRA